MAVGLLYACILLQSDRFCSCVYCSYQNVFKMVFRQLKKIDILLVFSKCFCAGFLTFSMFKYRGKEGTNSCKLCVIFKLKTYLVFISGVVIHRENILKRPISIGVRAFNSLYWAYEFFNFN